MAELDNKIITAARTMFLENGLMNVEMKDIAKAVGISRSTLYRHFESSLDIAYPIAEEFVVCFNEPDFTPDPGINGYGNFCLFIRSVIANMLRYLDKVVFITEFDLLSRVKSPDTPRAKAYEDFIRNYRFPILDYYEAGIRDGSIRNGQDGDLIPVTIMNASHSLVQRIALREDTFRREHGYALEMIDKAISLMLQSIRSSQ